LENCDARRNEKNERSAFGENNLSILSSSTIAEGAPTTQNSMIELEFPIDVNIPSGLLVAEDEAGHIYVAELKTDSQLINKVVPEDIIHKIMDQHITDVPMIQQLFSSKSPKRRATIVVLRKRSVETSLEVYSGDVDATSSIGMGESNNAAVVGKETNYTDGQPINVKSKKPNRGGQGNDSKRNKVDTAGDKKASSMRKRIRSSGKMNEIGTFGATSKKASKKVDSDQYGNCTDFAQKHPTSGQPARTTTKKTDISGQRRASFKLLNKVGGSALSSNQKRGNSIQKSKVHGAGKVEISKSIRKESSSVKLRNGSKLFYLVVWKTLEKNGWTLAAGKRQSDKYFLPPGIKKSKGYKVRVDYFDSVSQVLRFLKTNEEWKGKTEIIDCMKIFDKCQQLQKSTKGSKNLEIDNIVEQAKGQMQGSPLIPLAKLNSKTLRQQIAKPSLVTPKSQTTPETTKLPATPRSKISKVKGSKKKSKLVLHSKLTRSMALMKGDKVLRKRRNDGL